jgi:hypothetical protein
VLCRPSLGAVSLHKTHNGLVHPAYNPSFSACFFSRNSIFLSQQISQQCFSAGLSAQPNGANSLHYGLENDLVVIRAFCLLGRIYINIKV